MDEQETMQNQMRDQVSDQEKQYFTKSIRKGVLRFFKALHLYHFKHLKLSILFIIMFCISGLYNYYFIQNHAFAFNNHDLIESTLNNLELSTNDPDSKLEKKLLPYVLSFPKYGKWQTPEYLIVKSHTQNIQTFRNVNLFELPMPLAIFEMPHNRIFKTKYVKDRVAEDDANQDDPEIQNAQQDDNGNYILMGTKRHFRSYQFVNMYPFKQSFNYNEPFAQAMASYKKHKSSSIYNLKVKALSNNRYYVTFQVSTDTVTVEIQEILNMNTKQVQKAWLRNDSNVYETFSSNALLKNISFPTYDLYVNNQNLSNVYKYSLLKNSSNQTQNN